MAGLVVPAAFLPQGRKYPEPPSCLQRRSCMSRIIALLVGVTLLACGGQNGGGETTTTVARFAVSGYVHAGPVCPVETTPPDPSCADRPVPDAVILVRDAAGSIVAEARTAADGTFSVDLPPGSYTLIPQPVDGLMGTGEELGVVVVGGPVPGLDVAYDTGIR